MLYHRTLSMRKVGTLLILGFSLTGAAAQEHTTAMIADDGTRGTGDTLFVPPNYQFISTFHVFDNSAPGSTEPSTGFYVAPDVPWIDSLFAPNGQTSFNCTQVLPIYIYMHSPALVGIYEGTIVDALGTFPPRPIILKVAETPSVINDLQSATFEVDEMGNFPNTAFNVFGLLAGCTSPPFFPTPELIYETEFYPPVTWMTIDPDSVAVPTNTIATQTINATSVVPGSFTTYGYQYRSWYYRPIVTRYNVEFVVGSAIRERNSGRAEIHVRPNPTNGIITIHVSRERSDAGTMVFTDLTGREALRVPYTMQVGENALPIDLGVLPSGAYNCSLTLPGEGRIASRTVVVVR